MRDIRPEYEFPIEGRAWTRSTLPDAGVFFVNGDCHIVPQHGPAAVELEERGALLVAVVRFDARSPEGPVRPLDLREAVARFVSDTGGWLRPPTTPDAGAGHGDS